MADLVSGLYPQRAALNSILGATGNTNVANTPVRSNLEYTGINGLVDTAASLVTGVMTVVAVPVDLSGPPISKVSVLQGATVCATPTNQWAAIYAGTNVAAPALLGTTADQLAVVATVNTRQDFSFATP